MQCHARFVLEHLTGMPQEKQGMKALFCIMPSKALSGLQIRQGHAS